MSFIESTQLKILQNVIEARLNDFEAGFLDKEEAIKDFSFLIGECVKKSNEDLEKKFQKSLRLLMHLVDLQNGASLISYKDDWERTMSEIYKFLGDCEKDLESE